MVASATSSVCTAKLLVVEDDDSIRETVEEALRAEGFEVRACGDGAEAMNLLTATDSMGVDLLVLDLMLPGLGGLDLCRQLRKLNNNTPVLVISARDSETDRVLGLEVGADDYLVKPFGLRELVARCRALLRRSQQSESVSNQDRQVIQSGNLCLFVRECRVTRDGEDLTLSPKEYKILELLIQNPKRVWSRDQLLERIWGIDFVGDTKTVDVHIRWLREKIEEEPSSPQHIRTVRGFGYRFG
ncbi:response regulator transcription factor [Synechococcus sp. W2B2]|uniref:response regulator transcription factor n=1 Tax=unclassified Synechococcus TaxID=2626047 RepID=UPI00006BD742|nr:response regulator transcription factor [Synechococcus sp. WH 7805]EAR18022.1 two component transcriptional regulator, winged helix family protein [Synechococcus sp. WH 7805]